MAIVADAADGADGTAVVMGSAFTYVRYRDCARSQPPLAAEANLNPEGAEGGSSAGALKTSPARRLSASPQSAVPS
jgi:hypothetical protein